VTLRDNPSLRPLEQVDCLTIRGSRRRTDCREDRALSDIPGEATNEGLTCGREVTIGVSVDFVRRRIVPKSIDAPPSRLDDKLLDPSLQPIEPCPSAAILPRVWPRSCDREPTLVTPRSIACSDCSKYGGRIGKNLDFVSYSTNNGCANGSSSTLFLYPVAWAIAFTHCWTTILQSSPQLGNSVGGSMSGKFRSR